MSARRWRPLRGVFLQHLHGKRPGCMAGRIPTAGISRCWPFGWISPGAARQAVGTSNRRSAKRVDRRRHLRLPRIDAIRANQTNRRRWGFGISLNVGTRLDLGTIWTASHCGASRRGPGTRPEPSNCWRCPGYDGQQRMATDGGVGLQIMGDWVLRFNSPATGRAGRWEPGRTLETINADHRPRTAEVVEAGPVPAVSRRLPLAALRFLGIAVARWIDVRHM